MLAQTRSRIAVLVCAASLAPSASLAAAAHTGGDLISENNLRAHLGFVAHDLLEGRDTPSRGLDITAQYLAAQMQMYGAIGGGDNGTFFHAMPLERSKLIASETSLTINGQAVAIAEGYIPRTMKNVTADAEVIEVKSAWVNSKDGVDPFAGLDVKGKIIITDGALPQGVDRRLAMRSPDWKRPELAAAEKGAVAVLYVVDQPNLATWKRQLDRFSSGGSFMPVSRVDNGVPSLSISAETATKISSLNASMAPGSAPKVGMKMTVEKETAMTWNVVAIIPGTDPKLKDEFVAIGAHYDHVGIGSPDATGDTIYNGADDDGSGTVAMLEIARAIASGNRTKRSVLFVWHTGEEKGLWGSAHFCANPTVDLSKIAIQINLDMISMTKKPGDTNPRNATLAGPNELYLIGPKIVSSQITKLTEATNNAYLKMKLNDKHDTLDDPERIFFRSDHYSYIQKGVPAVFFFSGAHEHYHRPSDEVDVIDFEKLTTATRTIYAVLRAFGNANERPVIDGPARQLLGLGD